MEYNISTAQKGPRAAHPLPKKAIIKSIGNDKDGIGFRLAIQRQGPLVAHWEIERGELIPTSGPASTVLQPPYPFLKSTKRLIYIDNAVVAGVRYFYRVRGVNASGEGEWSEPVSAVQ